MLTMANPSPLVYTQLGVTLVGVRKDLCMIDYLTPGIHYLTPQPGSGKSTNTIQFLLKNKNLKALIISNNHNLFDSTYGILLNEANSVHYQGWSRTCLKYDEDIPQIKAKRYNPTFSPGYVCDVC
ncbi:MAG: hypothetical protein K8E24_012935, partial [Methanobacterium paludis]|nr:hypothetical protein [Methanobacterium paludis]